MPNRIVAFGECMVEMAPTGEAGTYRMGFAGDTFNTAWYLRRALPGSWAVDYVTAVGTDKISDQMVDFIASSGVGTAHVQRCADRTVGLYLITLQDAERHFSYWRSHSAAKTLARDPLALSAAMAGAQMVYFSGITLAILGEQGRATFLAAVQAARQNGAQAVFDPNLRPRLWESPETMRSWIMRGAEACDIVLPSFDDEAVHFGDADLSATAERYAQAGVRLVIVKNGPGEIRAIQDGVTLAFQPSRVEGVVDTTAAGDSFNAGFMAAYLDRPDVTAALAAGARLSGKVIQARGALVELAE